MNIDLEKYCRSSRGALAVGFLMLLSQSPVAAQTIGNSTPGSAVTEELVFDTGTILGFHPHSISAGVVDDSGDYAIWGASAAGMLMRYDLVNYSVADYRVYPNVDWFYDMEASPNGNEAFASVSISGKAAILRINLETLEPIETVVLSATAPQGIHISAATDRLYVVLSSGVVYEFQLSTLKQLSTTSTGHSLYDSEISPDGQYIYMTDSSSIARLYRYSTAANAEVDYVSFPSASAGLAGSIHVSGDGQWIMTQSRGLNSRAYRVNASTMTEDGQITSLRGSNAYGNVSAGGNTLFTIYDDEISRFTFEPFALSGVESVYSSYEYGYPLIDEARNRVVVPREDEGAESSTIIYSYAMADLTEGATKTLTTDPFQLRAGVYNEAGTIAYALADDSPDLLRFDVAGAEYLGLINLTSQQEDPDRIYKNPTSNKAYLLKSNRIMEFDMDSETISREASLSTAIDPNVAVVSNAGDYLYTTDAIYNYTDLIRIRLSDFSQNGSLHLSDNYSIRTIAIRQDDAQVWCNAGGTIYRTNVDVYPFTASSTINIGLGGYASVLGDPVRNQMYSLKDSTLTLYNGNGGTLSTYVGPATYFDGGIVDPQGRYLIGLRDLGLNLFRFDLETNTMSEDFLDYGAPEQTAVTADGEIVGSFGGGDLNNLYHINGVKQFAPLPLNVARGEMATISEAGSVGQINFYSHAATGNVRLGIYDEKFDLLWQSDPVANTALDTWLSVPVTSGTPTVMHLTAGNYWLVFQTDQPRGVASGALLSSSAKDTRVHFLHDWGAFPEKVAGDHIYRHPGSWAINLDYTALTDVPEMNSFSVVDADLSAPAGQTDNGEVKAQFTASGSEAAALEVSESPDFAEYETLPIDGNLQFTIPAPDRTVTIYGRLRNGVGVSTPTLTAVIERETGPPEVTVDILATNDNMPTVTGTVDDPGASVEVEAGGNSYTATVADYSWSVDITTPLPEGIYDVSVTASDVNGNEGYDVTADELTIDLTPPVVTVDSLITNDTTPLLSGTVDATAASVSVEVDSQTIPATINGTTWEAQVPVALSENSYEVIATATDTVGNSAPDGTSNELTVDTTPPIVTINTLETNSPNPVITGTIDETPASLTITVNGQVFAGTATGTDWEAAIAAPSEDGVYDLQATATDLAGNITVEVNPSALTLDTTPPEYTMHGDATQVFNITVGYTATDSMSGFASADLYVRGPGESNFTNTGLTSSYGGGSFTYDGSTADGLFEFAIVTRDNYGNESPVPTEADFSVLRNYQSDSEFVQTINGAGTYLFPMKSDQDVEVEVTDFNEIGDITISLQYYVYFPPEGTQLDQDKLIQRRLLVKFDVMDNENTLRWPIDSLAAGTLDGDYDTVYDFAIITYDARYTIPANAAVAEFPLVTRDELQPYDSFRYFYIGENQDTAVDEWMLLGD